jgi:hypothetical protein
MSGKKTYVLALILLFLVGTIFFFEVVPKHWMQRFEASAAIDGRSVPVDAFIGNPTDSEAEAVVFIRVPQAGDYFFDLGSEKYREGLSSETIRVGPGIWTLKPMGSGRYVEALPFKEVNQVRLSLKDGRVLTIQF